MEHVIKLGNCNIILNAPDNVDESEDRISLWWGLTTSSIDLAERIVCQENLSGEKVLELGSGIGLTGIAALIRGAAVTFSDFLPEALETVFNNVNINGLSSQKVSFLVLDWEDPVGVPQFDLILGAEIVYDYFSHGSLIKLMEKALAPNGRILLADRDRLVVTRFVGRLLSKGFVCKKQVSLVHIKGFPKQEITIFEIKRT
ncbi:MAG: methyltransferase domain-containing protein [Pseudomonadota bacterium]